MADSEDWIKNRAYKLWEEEGHPHGKDAEHWERAKQEYLLHGQSAKPDKKASPPRKKAAAAETQSKTTPVRKAAVSAKVEETAAPKRRSKKPEAAS